MTAPKRVKKPVRQALLVLGMHRSGTSAVSGLLTHLGAQAPRTVMPPTKDNPQGYWESVELMRVHDQVLGSAGSRWNDWGEFNPAWMDSPPASDLNGLLVGAIAKEYGSAPLFVVKDPRICRFVPLWLAVLKGARITPKVVIPVRHPLDVAKSLEVRDHFGRSRSLLLWLRHVLDAEAGSRSMARTFVMYENVLDDWRGQARKIATDLEITWPRWSGDTEQKIEDFLSEELRHHAAHDARIPGDRVLSEWASTVYRLMLEADERPLDKAALGTLDEIRAEFNRTSGMYAAVVREHQNRVEALHAKMQAQLSSKTQESEGLVARQAELSQKLEEGERALAARHEELTVLLRRVEEGSAERAEMLRNRELEDARSGLVISETKARLAQITAELEALKVRMLVMQETLAQAEQVREEHRQLADQLGSQLEASEAEHLQSKAGLERQLHDPTSQMGASNSSNEQARRVLQARVEALTVQIAASQQERERLREEMTAHLAASRQELDRQRGEMTTQLAAGQLELERQRDELTAGFAAQLEAAELQHSQVQAGLTAQVVTLTAELAEKGNRLTLAEAEATALRELSQAKDQEIQRLESQGTAAAHEFESHRAQAKSESDALRADNDDVRAASDALRAENDGLKSMLERSSSELEGQRLQLTRATESLESIEVSLQLRFREIAKLTEMVFALEQSAQEHVERDLARENERLASEREHEDERLELERQHENYRLELERQHENYRLELERQHELEIREHEKERENWARERERQFALYQYATSVTHAKNQFLLNEVSVRESTPIGKRAIQSFRLTPVGRLLRRGGDPAKKEDIALSSFPGGFAPSVELLQSSSLFDEQWYLTHYPDVSENGADPVHHYLLFGAQEGRHPGPGFDTVDYLVRYPDVIDSALNPLVHYLEYGKTEGREARPPREVEL